MSRGEAKKKIGSLKQSITNIFEARILLLFPSKKQEAETFLKSDGEASALRKYIQRLLAFETEEQSHVEYYN